MTKSQLIKALQDCPLPGDTPVHFVAPYQPEVPEIAKFYTYKIISTEDGPAFLERHENDGNAFDAIVLEG